MRNKKVKDSLGNHSIVLEERWLVAKLSEVRKTAAFCLTQPVIKLLIRTPIVPNALTWSGFAVSVGASTLIVTGHLFAAGFVVLLSGLFDMLDGALARRTNRTTEFGAVLDSTLDRLSEASFLLGILIFYLLNANERLVIVASLVMVTMIGSFMVSYTRAKAEALGLKAEIGFFTRTERMVVLALGLLLSQINYALIVSLAIILVFNCITVSQRLLYVWRRTKN